MLPLNCTHVQHSRPCCLVKGAGLSLIKNVVHSYNERLGTCFVAGRFGKISGLRVLTNKAQLLKRLICFSCLQYSLPTR
jgi:hypothetical protein